MPQDVPLVATDAEEPPNEHGFGVNEAGRKMTLAVVTPYSTNEKVSTALIHFFTREIYSMSFMSFNFGHS